MSRLCPLGGVAILIGVAIAGPCPAQLQSTLQAPATTGPALRESSSAFDAARGVTVLFAGLRLGFLRNEIYEWDGTDWSVSTVFPRPGPRGRPAIEFDAARGEIVMFGGVTSSGVFLNDTARYTGAAFPTATPATSPSARSGAAMAWDGDRQLIVMFGGFVAGGTDINDTWEWDGTNWTLRQAANTPGAPGPRGAHRLVYDPDRQQVVMFGGFSTPQFGTLNDSWQWNGTTWSALPTSNTPQRRCDQVMVFDSRRGRVLMYGGLTAFQQPGNIPVVLGDCWTLTAAGWEQKTVPGLPSPRSYALGAYDQQRDEIVMHSGFDNVTTTFSDTYLVQTTAPADMQAYGAGCTGSNGVPQLDAVSLPWLADDYSVAVSNVPGSTLGFMTLGLSATVWNGMPIPVDLTSFGLAGCDAWLGPNFSTVFVVQNGAGEWGTSVCNCAFAIGVQFSLQALVLDPGAPNTLGATMSNAQRATIGAW